MKDSVWLVENSWNDATHCDKVLLPDFGGNTHTHTQTICYRRTFNSGVRHPLYVTQTKRHPDTLCSYKNKPRFYK